ncbi:MAG: NAD(P)/FAD-dependent oxidoreductase [Proteobacteria bacterium]|nr:NAD(P)/FAD-dependent oxidoreductase [Pseudomonadota bacterium]
MGTNTYDVVIAGGGHNGLIVGAYLAKAGLSVCVVERQDKVGGGVVTREWTLPGFKHDIASLIHMTITANPLIHRDELELQSKYGLKYIYPDPACAIVFPDHRALVLYQDMDKTCESIAQFSQRDAETYPRFCEYAKMIRKGSGVPMFSPANSFGQLVAHMDSSDEGREYLRVILSSSWDLACEWFESEQMRIALARFSSEVMIGPREKGTGVYMFGFPHFQTWKVALPEGGSGALSDSLAACIEDHGGTIRVSSPIKAVKVEGDEAKGVILESGEEIFAKKAVVSNLNVKQLFLQMLSPEDLPGDLPDRVRRIEQSSFMGFNQGLALNEAPKYRAGKVVDECFFVEITPFAEEFLRIFENYTYGIPNTKMPLLAVATLWDPTRAPEGKHTLYLYHYEPYDLKDGGPTRWNEIKEALADGIMETVREYCTNMPPENILGRCVLSPYDFEQYNPAMVHGDLMHIGAFLTQYFSNRPLPGWGRYRTPVKRLYMCGGSTHPGAGVTGGGRAATKAIMEDLSIDFRKIAAKK